MRLAAWLQSKRRESNMTQQQVAAEVGVHQTRVSHWERGSRFPNPEQLEALASLFGVKAETLVAEHLVDNDVERALMNDPLLRNDDKQALMTLYRTATRATAL
ncbi:helix-turn-helix domain-containing protein [Nocardioides gansuensis]|nr:helix-turn-helix transcriptional regulator [Nocardioides gansuensis]